jgi:hypothetical protein
MTHDLFFVFVCFLFPAFASWPSVFCFRSCTRSSVRRSSSQRGSCGKPARSAPLPPRRPTPKPGTASTHRPHKDLNLTSLRSQKLTQEVRAQKRWLVGATCKGGQYFRRRNSWQAPKVQVGLVTVFQPLIRRDLQLTMGIPLLFERTAGSNNAHRGHAVPLEITTLMTLQ